MPKTYCNEILLSPCRIIAPSHGDACINRINKKRSLRCRFHFSQRISQNDLLS
ncbi:hypothetical protein A7B25_003712 [Salmonella enterica subsp. enterica serovar Havana]|uniref:Uncharacterized protein n=3 Tax=Salmonella enterica I TaxID=59201 RepID=A0A610IN06_SALET|nr:hypothetical protein [Salmonella enterica subsp. enterica serovar Havana]EAM4251445.1 hypothetical protein [Salmonella enterica]EBU2942767.1 hypothetical protein [Salmonella enterica subsp. enterica]EBU8751415.1 hypothetical protein [Salmonella enterica subsp. enterica serovar Ordonez]EAM6298840.1 hypothetical protein [Salmonella enterica]